MSLPVSRDMLLDPGTFGNSPACHVVVQMMNEGLIPIRDKHRVLSMMNDVGNSAKHLSEVRHPGVRNQAIELSRDYYCSRVELMPYHDKFKSHLKNVIHHIYKKNLERVMRVDRLSS
jgi:hypothetical protein